jgi:ankyrin repeat protein
MAVTDQTKHQIAEFLLENPKVIYNPEPKLNHPPETETDFLNVNILFQRTEDQWVSVRKETTKPDQQVSLANIFDTSGMQIESAPVPVEYSWESQCVKSTHSYNLAYWTYLHGHTEFFDRIIALGGNLTFKLNSKPGFTPLILMIRQNDYKSLHKILTSSILQCSPSNPLAKKNYDWTVVDNKGWNPIHHAVSPSDYGSYLNTDLLKLLTMFFDLNKKDNKGRTPLSYSLEQDNKIFYQSLLELGAVEDASCLGVQRCPTSAIGIVSLFDSENWAS